MTYGATRMLYCALGFIIVLRNRRFRRGSFSLAYPVAAIYRWHKKTGTFEMRSGSHVQLAALRNRDLELQTTSQVSNHGSVARSTACFRHKNVLVLLGFQKFPFFVSPCTIAKGNFCVTEPAPPPLFLLHLNSKQKFFRKISDVEKKTYPTSRLTGLYQIMIHSPADSPVTG